MSPAITAPATNEIARLQPGVGLNKNTTTCALCRPQAANVKEFADYSAYEREKRLISGLGLSPEEYQDECRRIARRLGF